MMVLSYDFFVGLCLLCRSTVFIDFFFFSSRRRHTRCLSDWSSDVCSSDLVHGDKSSSHERPRDQWIEIPVPAIVSEDTFALAAERLADNKRFAPRRTIEPRSEERRVGKEDR